MDVVDDVRRVGALHVEIDLALLEQLREFFRCGHHDHLAHGLGIVRELARDVICKLTEAFGDFAGVDRRHDSQRDRFRIRRSSRLLETVAGARAQQEQHDADGGQAATCSCP